MGYAEEEASKVCSRGEEMAATLSIVKVSERGFEKLFPSLCSTKELSGAPSSTEEFVMLTLRWTLGVD